MFTFSWINQIQSSRRFLICVCFNLCILASGYVLFLHDIGQQIKNLLVIEIELKEQLITIQNNLFGISQLQKQLDQMQLVISKHHPSNMPVNLTQLIEMITNIVGQSGMTLLSIQSGEQQRDQNFSSVTLYLHSLGNFKQFMQYLFLQNNLEQMIVMPEIKLTKARDSDDLDYPTSSGNTEQLMVDLKLMAYYTPHD